jgi:glutathione-specific gamma-glutamylcyclotransferase
MRALESDEVWNDGGGSADAPGFAPSLAASGDLWLFAYGSLMWDPGFAYCAAKPALAYGHHRRFCVYSHGHRGTPERPGLVLGLDRGGACKGIAYRIPAVDVPDALAYLWGREMQSRVYRMKALRVRLKGGRIVTAHAFVVDRAHPAYAGDLSLAETARLIRQGVGRRGSAHQYLENAVRELERLGVIDGPLHRLQRHVAAKTQSEKQPTRALTRTSNSRSSCTGRSLRPE